MYLLVFLFLYGFLTDSCNGCTTGTFSFNNECRQCPENCNSCDSETMCNLCKIGYHGETCSLACPQHCHDNECEKTSGTCLSCMKGYYSSENKTCIKCPESCATCRSNRYCFACKSGYRGDFCEIACSNCKEGTSCDKNTGYCLDNCRTGLSGELCDKKCNVKCKSCVRRNNNECTTCALDKHGTNCDENCSSNCYKNECNDSYGVCTNGCSAGYWGPMCENLCSANCKNSVCMIQNGTCLEGCTESYYEHNCSKAIYSKQANNFGLVVGLAISGVFAIVVAFTCYFKRAHLAQRFKWLPAVVKCPFLCCRCFNKGKPKDEEIEVVANALNPSSEPTNAVNSLGENETEGLLVRKSRIESNGGLSSGEGKLCNNSDVDFESSKGGNCNQHANDETHSHGKNTFKEDNNTTSVIDVDTYKGSGKYIASCGPIKELLNKSFWKMICEVKCQIVVILTVQDSEEFKHNSRCDDQHGDIKIIFKKEHTCGNYTMSNVTIQRSSVKKFEEKHVVLFEFFAWSNENIPYNVKSFLEFHEKMKEIKKNKTGPILVHCSAGFPGCVTYIAFDMLQKNAQSLNRNDIDNCLEHLKTCELPTSSVHNQIDRLYEMLVPSSPSHQ